jgi:hypothetical protein
MKKPAHTPTQPTAGDAQPNEDTSRKPGKRRDATTQRGVWAKPTAGDAQPNEDTSRKDERRERQDTRQVEGDKGSR